MLLISHLESGQRPDWKITTNNFHLKLLDIDGNDICRVNVEFDRM